MPTDRVLGLYAGFMTVLAVVLLSRRKKQPKDNEAAPRPEAKPIVPLERAFYAVNPMTVVHERVVVAMVGLPARGKSYMSKAVIRYLNFLGCPTKLFNAGNKRRTQGLAGTDSTFFDAGNAQAKARREEMAMETLNDLLTWIRSVPLGCACGIFDATNTTIARREAVIARCAQESPPVQLIFVESICNDKAILDQNYRMKLQNEDYQNTLPSKALQDFLERIAAYEKVYESITDSEASSRQPPMRYVQTVDAGRKLVASRCDGFVMSSAFTLLHSITLSPRKLSLILAGETENDRNCIRGGDTCLSEDGLRYSAAVCDLVRKQLTEPPLLLAGTLRRYTQLTEMLREQSRLVLNFKALNELCFGSLEELGLAGGRMRFAFPEEHAARAADKLNYRYPGVGGESYMDLIMQLRDVVLFIERAQYDIVVVCDVAVARVLLGYIQGVPIVDIPNVEVSPGLIELTRSHSGFECATFGVEEGRVGLLAQGVSPEYVRSMWHRAAS